jgi:hypothetical protein
MDSRSGTCGIGKDFLGVTQKLDDTPVAFARKQLLCKVAPTSSKDGFSATRTAKTRIEPVASQDAYPHGSSPKIFRFPAPTVSVRAERCSFKRSGVN